MSERIPERRIGDSCSSGQGVRFLCACGCGTEIRVVIREDRVSGRVVVPGGEVADG